ncbi:hypothetical protein BASA60_009068 [Batrachochytrium salamandrivorans]|nr:hypothetical protein BASA60_009068 [Batrachochytrium salamandrivorans]KAH6578011.1 hypothetical protein BASA62_000535 [Batrachochytrium salamandrivorans]
MSKYYQTHLRRTATTKAFQLLPSHPSIWRRIRGLLTAMLAMGMLSLALYRTHQTDQQTLLDSSTTSTGIFIGSDMVVVPPLVTLDEGRAVVESGSQHDPSLHSDSQIDQSVDYQNNGHSGGNSHASQGQDAPHILHNESKVADKSSQDISLTMTIDSQNSTAFSPSDTTPKTQMDEIASKISADQFNESVDSYQNAAQSSIQHTLGPTDELNDPVETGLPLSPTLARPHNVTQDAMAITDLRNKTLSDTALAEIQESTPTEIQGLTLAETQESTLVETSHELTSPSLSEAPALPIDPTRTPVTASPPTHTDTQPTETFHSSILISTETKTPSTRPLSAADVLARLNPPVLDSPTMTE